MTGGLLVIAGALAALAGAAFGQETRGAILGQVKDPSGASVPGAEITVTNALAGVKYSSITNAEGLYSILYLPAGTYSLSAKAPGFRTLVRDGIEVRINDRLQIDLEMQMGEVAESVTVTSEVPPLEAATAAMGTVIDQRRMSELPVLHGNPMLMLHLTPGMISTARNMSISETRAGANARHTEFVAGGGASSSHEVTLDGGSNTTHQGGNAVGQKTVAYIPPAEAVNEMKVQTVPLDASTGNTSGGVINLSLKSGTNQPHGAIRYFRIQPGMNANAFFSNKFGLPRDRYQNDHWVLYGSGPVYLPRIYNGKDRSFFMYAFEHQHDVNPAWGGNFSVPTEKQRRGDFSDLLRLGPIYQIYDPATAVRSGARIVRSPLPGNILPASRFNPASLKIMEYYPLPLSPGAADGTLNFPNQNLLQDYKYWSHTFRTDQVLRGNQRMFVRGHTSNRPAVSRDYLYSLATGRKGDFLNRGAGIDHVFFAGPSLVTNVRYSYTRFIFATTPKSAGMDLTTLGFARELVSQFDLQGAAFPRITIAGLTALGETVYDRRHTDTHHMGANLDWLHGKHARKMGVDYRIFRENRYNWYGTSPVLDFGTDWTRGPFDNSPAPPGGVGLGFASFLLGLPSSGSVAYNASSAVQSSLLAVFLQNDWRAASRLTVNFGLRYEVETPNRERFNRTVRGLDDTTLHRWNDQVRTNYARNPTPELPVERFTVKGGLLFAGVGGQPRTLFHTDKWNVAPRLGLVLSLGPRTIMRLGYGLFFDSVGVQRGDAVRQFGFSQATPVVPTVDGGLTFAARLDNPFPNGLLRPPGASRGLDTYLGQSISFFNSHPRTAYNQRWQFSFQRQLPARFVVEAAYVGNRGVHIEGDRDLRPFDPKYLSRSPVRDQPHINYWTAQVPNPFFPLLPGTGLASSVISRQNLVRMANLPQFTSVTTTENSGYSWFHSLEVRTEKRFSSGYTVQAGYLFSKFMTATDRLNGYLSPLEEVISSEDRPHRFTLSGIYELPFGPGRWLAPGNPVLKRLAEGWQIQWIHVTQSGPPLGFGNALVIGDLRSVVVPSAERTPERWLNPAPFNRVPGEQLLLNYRVLSSRFPWVRGDGRYFWNASLIKNTTVREKLRLQLRLEAFNALNQSNFDTPVTTPTSVNFGVINLTTLNPRLIQLGAKLMW